MFNRKYFNRVAGSSGAPAPPLISLLSLAFVFASSGILAQQPADDFEEIVVVANRIAVPLKQIAASVTVVDSTDIEANGNFSLADILRQTPAIAVTSNGGAGSLSSIRIRGEEGFRTLTLYNGLKLSDPSGPQVATSVEHILSNGIDRVEILRGPQGLSYGADAGGIINISSAASNPGLGAGIDVQSGSRGTHQLGTTISAIGEQLKFSLAAAQLETDGYNAKSSDTVLRDDDGYENTSVNARLAYQLSDQFQMEFVYRQAEGETEYDGCYSGFTPVNNCLSIYDQQASRIALNYTGEALSHSLGYSRTDTDRDDLAEGISAFDSSGELNRWEYVGSASNLPGFDLIFGIDLEEEVNGQLSRNNKGYYIEYLSDFADSLFLSAGVRRDENDDFGEHDSSRISIAYLRNIAGADLKFKTSYGTGFRAPSLYEIDYNTGPFAFPPASFTSLTEEKSEGLEYGIEYLGRQGLRLEVVFFDQQVEDAIYFDLAGFSGYLQDTGTSTSRGSEFITEYAINEQLSLSGNITLNDTERPNGLKRLRRPERLANIGMRYTSADDRLHLNAFYRRSEESIDEIFGSPVKLDDFSVLDINASYQLSEAIQVFARVENASNEEYQEIFGFFAPDRASYIGFRVNF
jgi:vitamin B12 transporter